MASVLKVDTITGVTTAGSIAVTGEGNSTTTNLQQGLAKARCHFTTVTTTAVNESFNVTSLTDTGTGDTDVNLTNAFVNASIVAHFSVGGSNGDQSFIQTGTTASSIHCFNYNGNNSVHDSAFCRMSGHGELA